MYGALAGSVTYRDAVRFAAPSLPEWLVPFSVVDVALLERFATELQLEPGNTFVDLACGCGGPGIWVAEHTATSLIGVDFSKTAVATAAALGDARMPNRSRFVCSDIAATGLPDAERAAREIARLLKPGGRFVMTAAESVVDPFTETIVCDYRPILEAAGIATLIHEARRDHHELQSTLYRAIVDRDVALRSELGESVAAMLVDEARHGLEVAQRGRSRVREILFVRAKA